MLLDNNETTTASGATTATATAADLSINTGGVKGLKVAINTKSEKPPHLLQQQAQLPQQQDTTEIYSMLNKAIIVDYRLSTF